MTEQADIKIKIALERYNNKDIIYNSLDKIMHDI